MVAVAQLVRASGCGPEGREFESLQPPHFFAQILGKKITKTQVFTSQSRQALLHIFTRRSRSSLKHRSDLLACPAIARRATADEDAPFHSAAAPLHLLVTA